MDNLLFKRILISVLVVALLSYVGFLFYNTNFGNVVETEEAVTTTTSDVIDAEGFVVRKESYLKNSVSGVLSYNVQDGDNVSVNQDIADIYYSESDAVARQQIKEINSKISDLKALGKSNYKDSVGLDTVNSQIDTSIITLLNDINQGDLSDCNDDINNSLYYINERQIITGQVANFKSRISQLKAEKKKLKSTCSSRIGTVKSDTAGYYVSSPDGYENSLDYDNITDITVDDLNNVKKSKVSSDVVGKIITDPEWYIVCEVDKDQAVALSKLHGSGQDVTISIPFVSKQDIIASIYSINQESKNDSAVLVLCCDNMSDELSTVRSESIEIKTYEYTGLKVSKRALHEDYVEKTVEKKNGETVTKKKKVQGVYVLHGSELIFKEISIIYSSKQYVLCDPSPDDGILFNGTTVELYDQVVIQGDNLYDGKVIS